MPSISQELEATRAARWYECASNAGRADAWTARVRDYTALRAVLAERGADGAAGQHGRRPFEVKGVIKLVAEREHFAGHESVYKRYRAEQPGQRIRRLAGPDKRIPPAAAFLAEAKIVSFWPYREVIIKAVDASDMSRAELATDYLLALAAWADDERALAAYRPGGAPACVPEDMSVLAAVRPRQAGEPGDAARADRLGALADQVVRAALDDPDAAPPGSFAAVRDEVNRLLAVPAAPLADQLLRTAAELIDRLIHADRDIVITSNQAECLRRTLGSLSTLLGAITVQGSERA